MKKSCTKADHVYHQLKQKIISFKFLPGEMVHEKKIAELFHVSRTPVREALRQLTNEGFLLEEAGKLYVYKLSVQDIMEIFEVRESLECKAIQLLKKEHLPSLVKELKDKNQRMYQLLIEESYEEFFEEDDHFHKLIINSCANNKITEILHKFNVQVGRVRYLTILNEQRMKSTVDEHVDVISAMEKEDLDAAEVAMSKHIHAVQKTVREFSNLTTLLHSGLEGILAVKRLP
ncbi:GntR family transcriptional regulator [Alkalihalobacillus oceani]|uniref:GntR family transcriptional regulator n=1 Tax=Halalkalibacter oceani TaxID=1653776 RepID=UPI00203B0051|nr:GntR family transcriptional regulator [Halalkalibacter oceani]MCM3759991.1 GntR family transcriptional regulator [Halalkalibacter oceani]